VISFTSAQLSAWLAAFIFPLARILALIASSPLYGIKEVPARIKVGFAIAITIIIAPTLDIPANLDPASAQGLFVLMQQIVAGVIIGFSIRLIFVAVEMAGDLTGMQMGLGFASFYDPVNASFTPIVAQFLGILASLAFLSANGHLYILVALSDSFRDFPIGATVPSAHAFRTMAEWGGSLFSHALQFSLPLIGALLITNIALGILARSAPQLNIFAVGFPITIGVGFVTLWLTLPYLAPVMDYFTREGLNAISHIMLQLGGH
jgi:flagellar biosynthetic protein FliR